MKYSHRTVILTPQSINYNVRIQLLGSISPDTCALYTTILATLGRDVVRICWRGFPIQILSYIKQGWFWGHSPQPLSNWKYFNCSTRLVYISCKIHECGIQRIGKYHDWKVVIIFVLLYKIINKTVYYLILEWSRHWLPKVQFWL